MLLHYLVNRKRSKRRHSALSSFVLIWDRPLFRGSNYTCHLVPSLSDAIAISIFLPYLSSISLLGFVLGFLLFISHYHRYLCSSLKNVTTISLPVIDYRWKAFTVTLPADWLFVFLRCIRFSHLFVIFSILPFSLGFSLVTFFSFSLFLS